MSLETLPPEILFSCLSQLSERGLTAMTLVNHYFSDVLYGDGFWEDFTCYQFPSLYRLKLGTRLDWREIHRQALTLYGFGDLGLLDYKYRSRPARYPGSDEIRFKQIANGLNFTVGIDINNKVW